MKQETNTAATTLEQVNAMPAATWGWLKMNQTKLELSDELATAPAEAVEVEGLEEQFAGTADAFNAAMEAMAERFPERRASAPGDAADEPASTNTAADEAPEYNEDMKLDELKEVATRYGVDASAMRKKADVIAAIEATKAEQPDDSADDEEPPQIGAADPV